MRCICPRIGVIQNDSSFWVLIFFYLPKAAGKRMDIYYSELTIFWFLKGAVASWIVFMNKHVTVCFLMLREENKKLLLASFLNETPKLTIGLFCTQFWMHHSCTNFFWASVNKCRIQRAHSFQTPKRSSKILCKMDIVMFKHVSISILQSFHYDPRVFTTGKKVPFWWLSCTNNTDSNIHLNQTF